jgi:hypothetical protein
MLTPRSALELNYSFAQYTSRYSTSFLPNVRIHTRQQEITGAYIYNFRNFRNFNPFVEAGVGGLIFTPIRDFGTTNLDTKQNTNVGALFGGGVPELGGPQLGHQAEYRGLHAKAPIQLQESRRTTGVISLRHARQYYPPGESVRAKHPHKPGDAGASISGVCRFWLCQLTGGSMGRAGPCRKDRLWASFGGRYSADIQFPRTLRKGRTL